MQVGSDAKEVMDFFWGLLVSAVTCGEECWGGVLAQLCLLPSICGSSRLVQGFLSGHFLCKPLKQALMLKLLQVLPVHGDWPPNTLPRTRFVLQRWQGSAARSGLPLVAYPDADASAGLAWSKSLSTHEVTVTRLAGRALGG